MNAVDSYPSEKCCEVRQVNITENLELTKARLEANLAKVNAALEGLKANPEVERVLNLVAQAGRL